MTHRSSDNFPAKRALGTKRRRSLGMRRLSQRISLETRIVFDGAGVATADAAATIEQLPNTFDTTPNITDNTNNPSPIALGESNTDFHNETPPSLEPVFDVERAADQQPIKTVLDNDGVSTDDPQAPLALTTANLITVTTNADVIDGNTSSVSALNSDQGMDGEISLREAIIAANNTSGMDTVHFNIGSAGAGHATITPDSLMTIITDPIVLDATTQPGYAGDPIVELDGKNAIGATGGLVIHTSDSVIRGFIIHSFADEGLEIAGVAGAGDNNLLENNWIGIDANGNAAPNAEHGILVTSDADNNIIRNNVISSNTLTGILIRFDGSDSNVVQNNLIGVAPDGSTPLGNGSHGIMFLGDTASNLVGGTHAGESNLIAHNAGDGIHLAGDTGDSTSLLGNSIYNNAGLAIDLVGLDNITGNTINDVDDIDSGANQLQNYPEITAVVTDEVSTVVVKGTLKTDTSTIYRIEFFANSVEDNSGFGEAQRYIGFTTVTTDTNGHASFDITLDGTITVGETLAATAIVNQATNTYGATSELARNAIVTMAPNIADNVVPMNEDSSSGTVVVNINDVNTGSDTTASGRPISYEITGGNESGLFVLNSTTGSLSLADNAIVDYETQTQYLLTVSATDGFATDNAFITMNIIDSGETPSVTLNTPVKITPDVDPPEANPVNPPASPSVNPTPPLDPLAPPVIPTTVTLSSPTLIRPIIAELDAGVITPQLQDSSSIVNVDSIDTSPTLSAARDPVTSTQYTGAFDPYSNDLAEQTLGVNLLKAWLESTDFIVGDIDIDNSEPRVDPPLTLVAALSPIALSRQLYSVIDGMTEEIKQSLGNATDVRLVVGSVTFTLSMAYLLWLAKTTSILGSMITARRISEHFDPLPMLSRKTIHETDNSDDDIDMLFDKNKRYSPS